MCGHFWVLGGALTDMAFFSECARVSSIGFLQPLKGGGSVLVGLVNVSGPRAGGIYFMWAAKQQAV